MADATEIQSQELMAMKREYHDLTGEDFFCYSTHPGDGQHTYVFQDKVIQGINAALAHMKLGLEQARRTGEPVNPYLGPQIS